MALRSAGQPAWFALRLLAFWLLFFTVFRVWFIAGLHAEWTDNNPWPALWRAWPLDLSMAGYLLSVPVLLWFIGLPAGAKTQQRITRVIAGYHIVVFGILIFVFGANVFLYAEWHTPLNNRALEYFRTPTAMLDSMSLPFKIGSVTIYIFFAWVWWRLYRWVVGTTVFPDRLSNWNLAWLPVLLGLLFLAIRGGLGVIPVNESAVYYSPQLFNNHAATNAAWHVIHSLIETRSTENHYRFMDDGSARQRVAQLYPRDSAAHQPHNWLQLPAGHKPNIVFIMMESMTAQVVGELGGVPGVCPNLGRLAGQGLLFDRCYGSGYRTDQGLVSVLGGFPAQPDQSIVLLQDKAAKLPSVPKMLRQEGYATAFFYGGELTFANIGVWLTNQKFDRIFAEKDFPAAAITQRWGADDRQVFNKAIATLRETPQPFFSNILTLSLHPPFDVPYRSQWTGDTEREQFLNSAAFADAAIGAFFEAAAAEPWFANTLFVLVADHGHYNPTGVRMDDPRSRQVPLIITGPLIRPEWRGRRIHTLGNHHDIPATILDELGFSSAAFTWSKDLFDPHTRDFAYYTNENGLGWVTPAGAGFYPFEKRAWQWFAGPLPAADGLDGQAYLQELYEDFLKM